LLFFISFSFSFSSSSSSPLPSPSPSPSLSFSSFVATILELLKAVSRALDLSLVLT